MADKVSAVDVFKEAIAFTRYKIKYVFGLLIVMLIISLPMEWSLSYPSESGEPPANFIWVFLVTMVLSTVVQAGAFNNFISTLRGDNPPVIPSGLAVKTLKVFLKEVLVLAAAIMPGLAVMALFVFGGLSLLPGGLENVEMLKSPLAEVFMEGLTVLGLMIGFGIPMLRWGAGVAGAAVGESVSFKQSWRMTKGHSFRLVVFLMPLFAVQLLVGRLLQPALSEGSFNLLSPEVLVATFGSSITYWFSFVAFSIWYVRLTQRYEAIQQAETLAE